MSADVPQRSRAGPASLDSAPTLDAAYPVASLSGKAADASSWRDNRASPRRERTRVKTYDIEVQRLKSAKLDKGMIELGVDALVLPRPSRDDESSTSSLRLPVDHARSLLILLKQQLAEVDKLQPRSRRSGRS
jgi:hypothetical protein